jgi:hypothetical protein
MILSFLWGMKQIQDNEYYVCRGEQIFLRWVVAEYLCVEGKGKFIPRTGHEGSEGE